MTSLATVDPYVLRDGVHEPPGRVEHREDEYHSQGFEILQAMQRRHFWYRGRHRFVLHAVERLLAGRDRDRSALRAIDLGGGCGGWVEYLLERPALGFSELALGDSSLEALRWAARTLPDRVRLFRVDLMDLGWSSRWDLVFLLDVLEHIPDDRAALAQVHRALAPGGLLVVTTPALRQFWTWNDAAVGHQRRYHRGDFARLARDCGFRLLDARYFMFALSPLLLAGRWLGRPRGRSLTPAEVWDRVRRMHRVPNPVLNGLLGAAFGAETPLGHRVAFPWGTSVLAVLQRPADPGATASDRGV